MRLWSEAWSNGDAIPARFAAGRLDGDGRVVVGENVSPPLQWAEVPAGALSLALICHDFDVPAVADDVNQPGREVAADAPRVEFFHWLLFDLPPRLQGLAEGEFGRGFVVGGKPGPATLHGARHGLNDFTGWFADDPARAGRYHGYDGPWPPFNDALVHHYVFALYALDIARLPLEGSISGAKLRETLHGHVLATATFSGTYTLNRRLLEPH